MSVIVQNGEEMGIYIPEGTEIKNVGTVTKGFSHELVEEGRLFIFQGGVSFFDNYQLKIGDIIEFSIQSLNGNPVS